MGHPARTVDGEPPVPPGIAGGFVGVTIASIAGNVFAYLLLLVAARTLSTSDYSEVVALLNVLLVGSVPAFALQTVTSRRVALGQSHDLMRVSVLLSLVVGLIFLLLVPFESAFLHLERPMAAVLLATALPGITLQGLCLGLWQGAERFGGLALTTLAGLVGRAGAGLVGLAIGGTTTTTMFALAVGVSVVSLVCLRVAPRPAAEPGATGLDPSVVVTGTSPPRWMRAMPVLGRETAEMVREIVHASHAFGVFLLLSVTDLLLASNVLDDRGAAIYAAGSVVTKATLWAPQSLATVLFTSMTDHERHRSLLLRGAGLIATLGLIAVGVCAVAGRLVDTVVAGDKYPELSGQLWLFALVGASLAVTQFALVSGLALGDRRVALLVWTTIVAEVCFVLLTQRDGSPHDIVSGVAVLELLAAAIAILMGTRRTSRA